MIRNIVLWSYERASWQWDVLCLLIVAFIFLTPKAWFDKREKLATQTPQVNVKVTEISSGKVGIGHNIKSAGNITK